MFYPVVKHAGSDRALKKCRGKTRDVVNCFSLLLECSAISCVFYKVSQQNRAQSRLLYLFNDKESIYFPINSANIFKPNFILSHMGLLIWVKFAKIPKQKIEIQLTVQLFSDKAVSANQSGRYLTTLLYDL